MNNIYLLTLFPSQNTHFCKDLFWVWFSFHLCIWFSPVSQPPSKLQLSIPPSFSPCLLLFPPIPPLPPPVQTSSQTQRVDGKYDWILPWLQIMCKTAGERGTSKNRGEWERTGQWTAYLKGSSLYVINRLLWLVCHLQVKVQSLYINMYMFQQLKDLHKHHNKCVVFIFNHRKITDP